MRHARFLQWPRPEFNVGLCFSQIIHTIFVTAQVQTKMANADALTRLPLTDTIEHVPEPADHTVLLNHLNTSPVTATQIQSWTNSDPLLSRIRRFILSGWPDDLEDDPSLRPYIQRKSELAVLNECVLWGTRVVIPNQGHKPIIEELHRAHPGITRMKAVLFGGPRLTQKSRTAYEPVVYVKNIKSHHIVHLYILGNGQVVRGPEYIWTTQDHLWDTCSLF